MKRITMFDYGAGNLHSLAKALAPAGNVRVTTDIRAALDTDLLVLPGVGAFSQAAYRIGSARDTVRSAIAAGLPTIGICLGMQLLFDESEEGSGAGIGAIPGRVTKLRAKRIPQIGWNDVEWTESNYHSLSNAYFANTYVCEPDDRACVRAWSTHENERFASVVGIANTVGVQFHPEKSSHAGVSFLRDLATELMECK